MAQNDSEVLHIWGLIDSHFDTGLLSDEDYDEIDKAITAYKDKAVEEVLDRLHSQGERGGHDVFCRTIGEALLAERNRLKGVK